MFPSSNTSKLNPRRPTSTGTGNVRDKKSAKIQKYAGRKIKSSSGSRTRTNHGSSEEAFFNFVEAEMRKLRKRIKKAEKRIEAGALSTQFPLSARTDGSNNMAADVAQDIDTLQYLLAEAALAKVEASEVPMNAPKFALRREVDDLSQCLESTQAENEALVRRVSQLESELAAEKRKTRIIAQKAEAEKAVFARLLRKERDECASKMRKLRTSNAVKRPMK